MPKSNATRIISIRMPEGAVEELRAATGQKFGTLARWILLALLEQKRKERQLAESSTKTAITQIVADMPAVLPDDD